MERFDVEQNDRLGAILDAVERGDEVVLARDGREVAKVIASPARKGSLDREKLLVARQAMASLRVSDGSALIRDLRDASNH